MERQAISHISNSQLDQFSQCPRMWYITKVLNEPTVSSDLANRGSQFDQVVGSQLGLNPMPSDPLIERVGEAARLYLANGGWTRADESQRKVSLTPAQWEVLADIYGVDVPLPYPIVGYTDLFRKAEDGFRVEICDLKTSERAEFRPSWALQCTLYALIERAYMWEVHLVTFTKQIKLTKYQYRPNEETFRWAMNLIGYRAAEMKRFSTEACVDKVPAQSGYQCRWCGWATRCEAGLVGNITATGVGA